ncbi:MAG: RnfABCDGE type electron transport complex subunit D [Nanoarchaeota archaeon]
MDFKSAISKFTIYQYVSAFLIILTLASAFFYGFGASALIPVLIAVLTATILDLLINYFRFKMVKFPYSAFISGLFIGGLLTQNLSWYTYAIAGIITIASKHLLAVNHRHIFNPANFGVLLVFLIFKAPNTWWISSPFYLIILFGLFILWRLKRFDLGLSFLLTYYLIHFYFLLKDVSPLQHFSNMVAQGGTIFFFTMFMLLEPKTHPAARKQRIFYGILAALMLIGIEIYNPLFGIPFVLAVANLFVPLLNRISFEFRKKNAENAPQQSI